MLSRLSLIGAVLLTALIGNWRVAASPPHASKMHEAVPQAPIAGMDVAAGAKLDGQLEPAVFARNPHVRFVYDRHVSKWM